MVDGGRHLVRVGIGVGLGSGLGLGLGLGFGTVGATYPETTPE